MENLKLGTGYIEVDGKRLNLTKAQVDVLCGNGEERHAMSKPKYLETYYFIATGSKVIDHYWQGHELDCDRFDEINVFIDKDFAKQIAYKQTLFRLMTKFALDNDDLVTDTHAPGSMYIVMATKGDYMKNYFEVMHLIFTTGLLDVMFKTKEICQRCIDEVVIPFTEKYPDFVW